MQKKQPRRISPYADRMGRFIGQLRDHQGITLKQLSRGLCEQSFLNKIENGEREVGKLMTDVFFQRLGKPVELFERILDHEEFVKWTQRQEIISLLRVGHSARARECAANYRIDEACPPDRQFLAIVEIDCLALDGMPAAQLLPLVENALCMTQPDFGKIPFDQLLLSQNEGRLLFAHLQLREKLEGSDAVAEDYRALARYFKHPRYESRERVYLFPYVACRVVENDYREGKYSAALSVCEDALSELTQEKRLFAYDELLAWKQKLFDAMGNPDGTPGRLLEELKKLLQRVPERAQLLVPCEEQGHVYCLNQVIRDRRALLGFSQEELSDNACGVRSLSRIENEERKLQRKNRKRLLQKVNMSGERYDYEIISERYEDYLLRSELDRAINIRDMDEASRLLSILRDRIPNLPTNQQFILKKEAAIRVLYPQNHPDRITIEEQQQLLEDALHLTLPLDLKKIDSWPVSVLTVNEILSLMMCATCYKQQELHQDSLSILLYIQKCLENSGTDPVYYEDLYIRLGVMISITMRRLRKFLDAKRNSETCMQLSLETKSSLCLSYYAYDIACNIEKHLLNTSTEMCDQQKQEVIDFLRFAFVAALITGDTLGQHHIEQSANRIYGINFNYD